MTKTARFILLDEINAKLEGVTTPDLKHVINELSFYVPGYKFMPAYKRGGWDGRIALISSSGKTFGKLLPDIANFLETKGYHIDIIDNRKSFPELEKLPEKIDETFHKGQKWKDGSDVVLRDYQVEAVNAVLKNQGGVLEMATGSGKTLVCATIAKIMSEQGNVVVMVPNIDLLTQTEAIFRQIGITTGIFYGELKRPDRITITTWQSLNNFREIINDDTVCLIVDECHQAKADVIRDIVTKDSNNVPIRVGCSGTIPKEDIWKKVITSTLGDIVFSIKSWKLQKDGVLASSIMLPVELDDKKHFRLYSEQIMNDMGDVQDVHFSMLPYLNQIKAITSHEKRNDLLAEIISGVAETGNTLVLVPLLDHINALHERLSEAYISHGKITKRDKIYKEFNDGDNGILIATYGVASTGLDLPRIHNVIFIEPGKKFEKIVQTIGRGLRKADDKSEVTILDIYGNYGISRTHHKARLKIYKEIKFRVEAAEKLEY